ncbi:unnamed protein product [Amoebophrya sp. A25]|nr:unnamed protein product [Amoebophrya sp. A25]|eukprot:GSA25T00013797001.1
MYVPAPDVELLDFRTNYNIKAKAISKMLVFCLVLTSLNLNDTSKIVREMEKISHELQFDAVLWPPQPCRLVECDLILVPPTQCIRICTPGCGSNFLVCQKVVLSRKVS